MPKCISKTIFRMLNFCNTNSNNGLTMADNQKTVAVIGAGITGLTTAFYLKKQGIPFHVFETAEHAGGVINTQKNEDFVWETGPSTGTISRPDVAELFEDLGGDILETAPSLSGNRYIFKGTKLHALPSGLIDGLKTPLFSWHDKLLMPFEIFRPQTKDFEENLSTFIKRRLGQSMLDYAVDPFVSGVFAGNPDTIIPRYALPKIYAAEEKYGSLFLGSFHKMMEKKTPRDRKANKKTFSAKGGLSTLVNALVKCIGEENISLGCKNLYTKFENQKYKVCENGDSKEFDKVMFAGSARRIPEAMPFLMNQGLDDAFNVTYTKVAEVAVGFKKWEGRALDGFGALMPSKEKRPTLGILFMSSLFSGRAPEGGAMLSVFMAGQRHPEYLDLSDDELFEMVKKDVCEALCVREFKPDLFKVTRHQMAIPQYDKSTPKRIAAFAEAEKRFPGLYLGGNGINGIGMGDRIKQGHEIALRIAAEM